MADDLWFQWRGKRSDNDMGISVTRLPPLMTPKLREERIVIPGRHGALHISDGGYDDMLMMTEIYLGYSMRAAQIAPIDQIRAWLTGSGELMLSDVPGRVFRARISDPVQLTAAIPGFDDRAGAVPFWAAPFQYATPNTTLTYNAGGTISNPGNIPSEPVITVYGSGTINLAIAGEIWTLASVNGHIILDCENKLAYRKQGSGLPDMLQTANVSNVYSKWPELPAGASVISWSGGSVQRVEIVPNWRWM